MNPLTNMRNVKKLSELELQHLPKSSWHDEYKSSAWIFVGGLPYDLSEGDVMTIFSQYGEITNLNLVRDKDTGKQKGFCFICYEDQRSTILAVDNFNGARVLGRILRVDHVKDYKPPKSSEPTSKIKTEKLDDDDFRVKHEFKTEIKEEMLSPEIKREICTPEIKREVCTPEIIRNPDYENNKKKKKDKDKRKPSRNKSKEKDIHSQHHKEISKEKDRNVHHRSEREKSYERENSNKRPSTSGQEKEFGKESKRKSYNEHSIQDRERDRKHFKDDKKEYQNKDHNEKNKRKYYEKDYDNYKKYKK